jgi:hypothetical protein
MRVLICGEVLHLGGAETVSIDLANALAKRGVEVAYSAAPGPLESRLGASVASRRHRRLASARPASRGASRKSCAASAGGGARKEPRSALGARAISAPSACARDRAHASSTSYRRA